MIKVIEEKCVGCGKCKKFCPMGVISLENNKAFITEKSENPQAFNCIHCGHCQAICSYDAIIIHNEVGELKKAEQNVDFEDLKNLIMSNRSIRSFKKELVKESIITDILRTLDYSASAKNEQKIKWIVISSKEKVEEIYQICLKRLRKTAPSHPLFNYLENVRNAVTLEAPHVLLAYADKESSMPIEDATIKSTLATILMHSQGIASCFLGFLVGFINTNKEVKNILGINENEKVYSALGFGYSDKEIYINLPTRKKADINFIS